MTTGGSMGGGEALLLDRTILPPNSITPCGHLPALPFPLLFGTEQDGGRGGVGGWSTQPLQPTSREVAVTQFLAP